MQNLTTAVRTAFPSLPVDMIRPELRLSTCPNWDSMNAVNLMMEIASVCGTDLKNYEPDDSTTLADLAAAIIADGGTP